MFRFRSWVSKLGTLNKPNLNFKEEFSRRGLHYPGKREVFTKSQRCMKELSFHWCRDCLHCCRTHQRNFIRGRSIHRINTQKHKERVDEKKRQRHVSPSQISSQFPSDEHLPKEEVKRNVIHTVSVKPSFNELVQNVLCLIDESMPNYVSNKSGDTQVINENDEILSYEEAGDLLDNEETQDSGLDHLLLNNLVKKPVRDKFKKNNDITGKLPCFKFKSDFLNLVANNQAVIVTGSTGSGKSTQLPQYVLDDFILSSKGSLCNIVCIVPRRVVAISLAERVAEERDEILGESIGYQIRFDNQSCKRHGGCINFMTPGVFLRRFSDPDFLGKLSHIFIDEAHERSIDCDLVLAILKMIMPKKPQLKIVLLSATTNVELFSHYMNGAPHLEIHGSLFPVEEYYLEDVLEKTKFEFKKNKCTVADDLFSSKILPYVKKIQGEGSYPKYVTHEMVKPESEEINTEFIAQTVRYILENEDVGCILIFMPGLREIVGLETLIKQKPWYSPSRHNILPMHSVISANRQRKIFVPSPEGVWKIIIATPILETSVTVNEIKYVIDTGRVKCKNYDVRKGLSSLETEWISKTNAVQRRGRAGRVQQGKCFKLYSKAREETFLKFPLPEFLCVNLEEVYLKVKALNFTCVKSFFDKLIDPPEEEVFNDTVKFLKGISALDTEGNLTTLGRLLSQLPLPPQLGKLLLMGSIFRCIDPISSVVAYLNFKSPFSAPLGMYGILTCIRKHFAGDDRSDHLMISRIMDEWRNDVDKLGFCSRNMLSHNTMVSLDLLKNQYGRDLYTMKFLNDIGIEHPNNNLYSRNENLVKAILCAGLYPNYVVLREVKKKKAKLRMSGRELILFHSKSCCKKETTFESPYFVYYQKIKSSSVIFIHDATMVDILPIILFAKDVLIVGNTSKCTVIVDKLIKVNMPSEVAYQLNRVRIHLKSILESAFRNPDILLLLDTDIIPSIVELLSSEMSVTAA